jgi:DNA-directed RNA polymerase sigma subunit (sigma70/sigma32)
VDEPVALYERHITAIADVCADPWFSEQLTFCRAGDDAARRRISGSCLWHVLQVARRTWQPGCAISLLDLIQEGNATLVDAIDQFTGETAEQFLFLMRTQVESRLTSLVEHGV